MDGYLEIHDLRIHCTIGLLEFEKTHKQEILVDLSCRFDFSDCVQSDSIDDTLDYRHLGKIAEEVAQAEHFNLIETYANEVLAAVFAEFPVDWAEIVVRKKALPLADYVAVRLERKA